MYVYQEELEKKYINDIWELIKEADNEFVPPLSARENTTQHILKLDKAKSEGPKKYFEQILKQKFILWIDNGKVLGFMTYISDYFLVLDNNEINCEYISTIVVNPKSRNNGITRKMYEALMVKCKDKIVATRTWSTNYIHIRLLKNMNFEMIKCIENDRGIGIDTVYFSKKINKLEV